MISSDGDSQQLVPVESTPVIGVSDDNGRLRVAERLSQLQGLRVFRNVPLSELNSSALQDFLGDPAGLASGRNNDGN